VKTNLVIISLFAFAAGQFATIGVWPLAAVLGWVVLIGLWRTFRQIDRIQQDADAYQAALPDIEPPVDLSQTTGGHAGDHPARWHARTNGGRRTADKA
jgi:hypothetical protein